MIETINLHREAHIVTIEDPIEFLHSHNRCLINQRELDSDTPSFASALKYVLRQDPDIVMISSVKDMPTVEAALTIAETGHLTLASIHTNTAIQTITRLVEMFPHPNHEYARNMLAESLEGIISQRLIKKREGIGRVLAVEISYPDTGDQDAYQGRQDQSDVPDNADISFRHEDHEPVASRTCSSRAYILRGCCQ